MNRKTLIFVSAGGIAAVILLILTLANPQAFRRVAAQVAPDPPTQFDPTTPGACYVKYRRGEEDPPTFNTLCWNTTYENHLKKVAQYQDVLVAADFRPGERCPPPRRGGDQCQQIGCEIVTATGAGLTEESASSDCMKKLQTQIGCQEQEGCTSYFCALPKVTKVYREPKHQFAVAECTAAYACRLKPEPLPPPLEVPPNTP